MMRDRPLLRPVALGVFLLLLAASRISRLDDLRMNQDEIWAVWQTFGTPVQIVQWTPYDWPPLYYLTLGAWRALTDLHPVILRYLSALLFLLGAAFLYRAARRLADRRSAWLTTAAFAALGYGILLSIEVRGYAPLLALLPLALWLTLYYFDHPRWPRAIPLGLCLAALFYTSLTSVGALLALGLYTFIVYGRAAWRWWLPGSLAALVALPEIMNKAQLVVTRTTATTQLDTPPLPQALYNLFWNWAGYTLPVWLILLAAAVVGLLMARRIKRHVKLAVLVWAFGLPLLLYAFNPLLGFFSARYAWWVMFGLALVTGIGLAHLPQLPRMAAGTLLLVLAFVPIPAKEYNIFENLSELGNNFSWLKHRLLPGDVVLADPGNHCGRPEEWDYYARVYFPNGLTFVSDPTGYRRVWYVLFDGQADPEMQAAAASGRITRQFVGPPGCLFRLYEAPPDTGGVLFENGMRFHGMDIIENDLAWSGPLVRREGETIRLQLWWSVDAPAAQDYSIGVYALQGDGSAVASSDSAPRIIYPPDAPPETSRWIPDTLYLEERELTLPFPTPRTTYTLMLGVYFWQDTRRFAAPGVNADNLLPLRRLSVMSY